MGDIVRVKRKEKLRGDVESRSKVENSQRKNNSAVDADIECHDVWGVVPTGSLVPDINFASLSTDQKRSQRLEKFVPVNFSLQTCRMFD